MAHLGTTLQEQSSIPSLGYMADRHKYRAHRTNRANRSAAPQEQKSQTLQGPKYQLYMVIWMELYTL